MYFLARHGEFRKYIKYIPPDFYLVRDGEKIVKLTPAALEDIIILQDCAVSSVSSVPSVAKRISRQEKEAQ